MQRPSVVLFDFDYTLGDSSHAVIQSVNFALTGLGLSWASEEAIKRTIGLSLPDTLDSLVGGRNNDYALRFSELFIERANEIGVDGIVVYDFVPQLVGELRGDGLALGIVSSKFRFRIEALLEREGLLASFDVIIGAEDVAEQKPDPEGLLSAIRRLRSTQSTSLFVGDTVTDAETATRADVPFVAVLSGMTPRERFRTYPVVGFLKNVSRLPSFIRERIEG